MIFPLRRMFGTNLFVFLKPKIISVDAVVPLMLEIKKRIPSINIHYLVPNDSCPDVAEEQERRSWNVLQRNEVLWQAMNDTGNVRLFHYYVNPYRGRLYNIARRLGALLELYLQFLCARRLCIFFLLMPSGNLFNKLCTLSNYRGISFEVEPSKFAAEGFSSMDVQLFGKKTYGHGDFARASISFSRQHYLLMRYQEKYLVGFSHGLPAWKEFVGKYSTRFFDAFWEQHPEHQYKKIILYCVSINTIHPGFGKTEMRFGNEGMQILFRDVMEILGKYHDKVVVFLKPHYVTDRDVLARSVDEFGPHNMYITHQHPEVVLRRASLQVSCAFSTTLWDGKALGVPTVEYSDYSSQYLEMIGNEGTEPDAVDYFINGDREAFDYLIGDVVAGAVRSSPCCLEDFSRCDFSVIDTLADEINVQS